MNGLNFSRDITPFFWLCPAFLCVFPSIDTRLIPPALKPTYITHYFLRSPIVSPRFFSKPTHAISLPRALATVSHPDHPLKPPSNASRCLIDRDLRAGVNQAGQRGEIPRHPSTMGPKCRLPLVPALRLALAKHYKKEEACLRRRLSSSLKRLRWTPLLKKFMAASTPSTPSDRN